LKEKHLSVVIVAGAARCGTSLMMAMLEAGGMDVAGVRQPFFEDPRGRVPLGTVFGDLARHLRDMGVRWWAPLVLWPFMACRLRRRIDPRWLASLEGCAVKLLMPHLLIIPPGANLALWMDRDEHDRADSLLHHLNIRPSPEAIELITRWFEACRQPGHDTLTKAGVRILDVDYEDLVAGPVRCRRAVDRIIAFLGVPLDREAMVARAAAYCGQGCDRDRMTDHAGIVPRPLRPLLLRKGNI
jgi:hypothetical protein